MDLQYLISGVPVLAEYYSGVLSGARLNFIEVNLLQQLSAAGRLL
jgi:hypothetical protein